MACMHICHVCIQARVFEAILAGVHTSLRNIYFNGFNENNDRARARALMDDWPKLRQEILSVLENHHLEWPQILSILRADDLRPITGTTHARQTEINNRRWLAYYDRVRAAEATLDAVERLMALLIYVFLNFAIKRL